MDADHPSKGVLFHADSHSYKFALAKALLGMAGRPDNRVPLEELAAPFARHLCEHLARGLLFVERVRRVDLTGVRAALNGGRLKDLSRVTCGTVHALQGLGEQDGEGGEQDAQGRDRATPVSRGHGWRRGALDVGKTGQGPGPPTGRKVEV